MSTISPDRKFKIRQIINVFENGRITPDYSTIYIYRDGPNNVRQITLGFGITEYGNLASLIKVYINDGGLYAEHFKKYLAKIGKSPLVDNSEFKTLLVRSSKEDPIMRNAQDKIYEDKYWTPALRFFVENGFTTPLAMAIILDSFVHSGSILPFLRKRFPAVPPSQGGSELEWLSQYVSVRHTWLANHSNTILNGTIYRTRFFKEQLAKKNWNLDGQLIANGVKIPAEVPVEVVVEVPVAVPVKVPCDPTSV